LLLLVVVVVVVVVVFLLLLLLVRLLLSAVLPMNGRSAGDALSRRQCLQYEGVASTPPLAGR
jgi:hypothetical protein